jgi:nicotinate phosphoribosyltransferase
VLQISGKYNEFGVFETPLLGFLCQASGIATMASRCRIAAGKKTVLSFGARRMHPALSPMIDRAAFIGGCDGVAVIKSAELLGIEPSGTMPHAFILIVGNPVEAFKLFHKMEPTKIKRIALIDTFGDEKFEAVKAAESLGEALFAVRLDTPSSRRGDFQAILEEVRWELDLRGFKNVKLFVSGGLDEYKIREFKLADAYGVGTALSSAPVIDFSMDIVEVDGTPLSKRGKKSGAKKVLRCKECFKITIVPWEEDEGKCECRGECYSILNPMIKGGKIEGKLPSPKEIRNFVLTQIDKMRLTL